MLDPVTGSLVATVGLAVLGVVWGLACLALKVLDLGAYIAHRTALRRA